MRGISRLHEKDVNPVRVSRGCHACTHYSEFLRVRMYFFVLTNKSCFDKIGLHRLGQAVSMIAM